MQALPYFTQQVWLLTPKPLELITTHISSAVLRPIYALCRYLPCLLVTVT
jgi:hypothetical protein